MMPSGKKTEAVISLASAEKFIVSVSCTRFGGLAASRFEAPDVDLAGKAIFPAACHIQQSVTLSYVPILSSELKMRTIK